MKWKLSQSKGKGYISEVKLVHKMMIFKIKIINREERLYKENGYCDYLIISWNCVFVILYCNFELIYSENFSVQLVNIELLREKHV